MAGRQTTICCSAVALIALWTASAYPQSAPLVRQAHAADDKTPLSLFPVAPIWTLRLNNGLTAPPGVRGALAVFALENSQLAAYDLEHGSRLWLADIATTVEPAIGADFVFVVTGDALMALSTRTGEVAWTVPFDLELAAAPVPAGDRLVLAGADGDVIALRANDGGEIWRRHLPVGASARPSVSSTRLFLPTADSQVVALDLRNGNVLWRRALGGNGHEILAGDSRVFLGSDDRYFYCLNARNGDVHWRWMTGADAIGLAAVDDRTVYFVSLDNVLRGLNRSSGVQRWKTPLSFRPIAGPLLYRDTLVVAGTAPGLDAYSTHDGKSRGRYALDTPPSAVPYLFADRGRVFPVLLAVSSDIVGSATVTGLTRDIEPVLSRIGPLPNVQVVPTIPGPPADLGPVNVLPNPIPVLPASE